MRSNSTSSHLNFPFKISIMLFINFFTESLVSLQSCGGLMFRRRMFGTPNFNVRKWGGMPGKSSEFKNSVGYLKTSFWFITISMDWYVVVSPEISFIMVYWLYLHHSFWLPIYPAHWVTDYFCHFVVDLGKLGQLTHWSLMFFSRNLLEMWWIVLIYRSLVSHFPFPTIVWRNHRLMHHFIDVHPYLSQISNYVRFAIKLMIWDMRLAHDVERSITSRVCRKTSDNKMSAPVKSSWFHRISLSVRSSASNAIINIIVSYDKNQTEMHMGWLTSKNILHIIDELYI